MRQEQKYDRIAGMLEDRAAGLTYAEIGAKYGISRQRVGQIYKQYNRYNFRAIKSDGCIYRNIRNWMNCHGIDRADLLSQIGLRLGSTEIGSKQCLCRILLGKKPMPLEMLNKIVEVSGMSADAVVEIG